MQLLTDLKGGIIMLKKTIKYNDYDGNEREEDFYFNLDEAELMEMELTTNGGLAAKIERIVKEQDNAKIIQIFKDIIIKSYGKKSEDGRRFIKNDEIREEFTQTRAYSALFMELSSDADAATKFIEGIIPGNIDMNDPKVIEMKKKAGFVEDNKAND